LFLPRQVRVYLSDEVALEAANDLPLAESLGGAPFDVGPGWFVVTHADDDGDIEALLT